MTPSRRRGEPLESSARDGLPTWTEIARDHGRFVFTVAFRLTGNRDDAQDVAQEVMIKVARGLATYRPDNLEGWLARITTNVFLDDRRRRARRPQATLGDDPDRLVPPSPSADESVAFDALPDHIQAAISSLAPEFRVALVLCDVVGFTYQEIAGHLDVPVGTVRSRIHRARGQLRELLS